MQSLKSKKSLYILLLAAIGAGYFGAFSFVDVHPILQNYLAFLPIQLGVLIYMLWWLRKQSNKPLDME